MYITEEITTQELNELHSIALVENRIREPFSEAITYGQDEKINVIVEFFVNNPNCTTKWDWAENEDPANSARIISELVFNLAILSENDTFDTFFLAEIFEYQDFFKGLFMLSKNLALAEELAFNKLTVSPSENKDIHEIVISDVFDRLGRVCFPNYKNIES